MSEELAKPPVLVGWVKLFHPAGVLCSLPIDGDTSGGFDYSKAFRSVQAAVLAGFTPNAPGLEAGEKREEVGYVIRLEKQNGDKTITPMVCLYAAHDAVKYKILTVYLNKDESVAAFEAASGMCLADLKVFPGNAAPERGAGRQSDAFIVKAPRQFFAVSIENPRYDEKEAEAFAARKEIYKVQKRVLVRWEGAQEAEAQNLARQMVNDPVHNATPDPMSREANGASDKPKNVTPGTLKIDQGLQGEWDRFLKAEPTVEELNRKLPYLSSIKTETTRRVIWTAVKKYAEDAERAWEFDGKARVFVAPVEAADEGVEIGKPIPF